MYNELNIYSNSTVSTKCCQFSLLENIFEKRISAGIEISSVKNTLLIVSLFSYNYLPLLALLYGHGQFP